MHICLFFVQWLNKNIDGQLTKTGSLLIPITHACLHGDEIKIEVKEV